MSCRSPLVGDTRGVVYVEFLLAFVPIFLLFLGIVQLGLVYPAKLMVNHAANRAVRSAVVVLDDDPGYYGTDEDDQPIERGSLSGEPLTRAQLLRFLQRAESGAFEPADTDLSRRATIELAAAAIVAPLTSAERGTIAGALTSASAEERAANAMESLRVQFLKDGVESEYFAIEDEVTVRVEYDYECSIPVVARLVCPGGTKTLRAQATLPNHGARYPYR